MEVHVINVDAYTTLFAACIVLLVGRFINRRVGFLEKYHIPAPVTGGLFFAVWIALAYYVFKVEFHFVKGLADAFMLLFFASIGLSADFKKLAAGGKGLVLLLGLATVMVTTQNLVGTGLAKVFGLDHLYGLLVGSVTLVGGHGTGGAWGSTFEAAPYYLDNAKALAFAAATWGLISGGILGGPVAQYLVSKHQLTKPVNQDDGIHEAFEEEEKWRPIRASSVTEAVLCLTTCMFVGEKLAKFAKTVTWFPNLPSFVYVLFVGIILRAVLVKVFNHQLKEVTIDVLGNVFLSLFLAISLLSIQIWTLASLAIPVTLILVIQTVVVVLYAIFVTFRVMGRDYDAAVISAGQVGFSLGATPTAIANMQSITTHFGPSHKAFLLIPLVGSFFIDLVNAVVISWFV